MPNADSLRRVLLPAVFVLLIACWLGGGATEEPRAIDEWLLLLSLPVLVLAVATHLSEVGAPRGLVRLGVAAALLIAAVPALQLLPLGQGAQLGEARQALAVDLAVAGVGANTRWTLSPEATERALWALLPALAMFLGALALPAKQRRRLLQLLLVLVLVNVAVAFFQAGLPRDSSLRLYPDFIGGFGGLLVNTNHQGTALIIGMVLATGLALEARLRAGAGKADAHRPWWYAALAVACLLLVPLSTSRAAMVIALPALAVTLALAGGLRLARITRSKRSALLAVGIGALAIIGVRAALGWMAVDQAEELRHIIAGATLQAGQAHAPLGSGIGSFTAAFEALAPPSLWLPRYVNHAHNEFAQWWLTGGWWAMLALGCVLVLLAVVAWRLLQVQGRGRQAVIAAASFVAILAALAHSWADYPLRTTTLMATVAALAGVLLAALQQALERDEARRHSPAISESGG